MVYVEKLFSCEKRGHFYPTYIVNIITVDVLGVFNSHGIDLLLAEDLSLNTVRVEFFSNVVQFLTFSVYAIEFLRTGRALHHWQLYCGVIVTVVWYPQHLLAKLSQYNGPSEMVVYGLGSACRGYNSKDATAVGVNSNQASRKQDHLESLIRRLSKQW